MGTAARLLEATEPLCVTLAGIAIPLPVVLGGVMTILLSMFLIAAMPEKGFRPTPVKNRNTWLSMLDTSVLPFSTFRHNIHNLLSGNIRIDCRYI